MKNDHLRNVWDQRADIHFAKKLSNSPDLFSELYNESWWGYIETLLSEIKNGRILEAGCGPGRWAERLAPMDFDMVLSDISPKMLQNARQFAEQGGFADKLSFEELDVCDMHSLRNDSFDMVISTGESVTLCADPQKAVREFCRVVRPGGIVICDAGNRYRKMLDLFNGKDFSQIIEVLETGEYISENGLTSHLLGPGEFVDLFKENKMEVLNLAGVTPLFNFPPESELKSSLEREDVFRDMCKISQKHAELPGVVNISSRLLAVVRKPNN